MEEEILNEIETICGTLKPTIDFGTIISDDVDTKVKFPFVGAVINEGDQDLETNSEIINMFVCEQMPRRQDNETDRQFQTKIIQKRKILKNILRKIIYALLHDYDKYSLEGRMRYTYDINIGDYDLLIVSVSYQLRTSEDFEQQVEGLIAKEIPEE